MTSMNRRLDGLGRQKFGTPVVLCLWVLCCLSALTATAVEIPLHEKDTDVLYLHAGLGGDAPAEFLFDTGSGYLVITEAQMDMLLRQGQAEYQRQIHAKLASGQLRRVAIYSIASLDLGAGCVLHNVEAAVLPGARRNILGMNVLKMVDSFSVSFNPSRLVLSGCQRQTIEKVASL